MYFKVLGATYLQNYIVKFIFKVTFAFRMRVAWTSLHARSGEVATKLSRSYYKVGPIKASEAQGILNGSNFVATSLDRVLAPDVAGGGWLCNPGYGDLREDSSGTAPRQLPRDQLEEIRGSSSYGQDPYRQVVWGSTTQTATANGR